MVATLRESKAKLSALVDRAARGEEVIITVRGTPRARLCPLAAQPQAKGSQHAWAARLREARARYSTGTRDTSGAILDDIRGDRS